MTKDEIRKVINDANGRGFANNINLNGYVFQKNGSFIIFELKNVEDVRVCHIKYIHFRTEKDLINILVCCCNFWMGNNVQFIFYKEKERKQNSAVAYLRSLNFRDEIIRDYKWKWKFNCTNCEHELCICNVHSMYK